MNSNEFMHWFEKEVKGRWKKHTFDWTEIGDWHWRLRKFDTAALTGAVRQHKACEDYKSPSLKKVYDHAKAIHVRDHPTPQRTDSTKCTSLLPEEHVFIMCVGKDFDGCGPVGHYLPVLMWPFSKSTTAEEYLRNAEAFARKHADFYGGVWEVFADTNQLDIMIRRRELLAEQPAGIGP